MMRTALTVLVLLLLLTGSQAIAQWDWNYSAFDGMSPFVESMNNKSPINYPNVGAYPSPGFHEYDGDGGELYDLEGIQVTEDESYLYVAIANSFGHQAYSSSWGRSYDIGDLFIGVNGSNNYGFAVNLNSLAGSLPFGQSSSGQVGFIDVDGWNGIPVEYGTYGFDASIASLAGPFTANGQEISMIDYFLGYDADYESGALASTLPPDGTTETYVWELRINKQYIGDFNSLFFSLTLECGNDLAVATYEAIPEPATLMLFGVGLLGAGIIRRRSRQ